MAERQSAEEALRRAHGELETRVRRRTEELSATVASLRQSEERFRGAFDAAAVGMALLSPDGRYVQVNRALCEIVGYTESELLEIDFQRITHPDDLEADLDHVRQVLDGEIASYQMEKRYLHKQGQVVWVVLSVSLVRGDDGRPLHFVSMVEDVTPRKRAEQALREATTLRDVVLASANFSIVATDEHGTILIFNDAAERWLGYQAEEMVGRRTPEVIHDRAEVARRAEELSIELGREIAPGFETFVARARLGECDERDWTYVRKDGRRFPVRLSITALRDDHGAITGFLGIASDQTERQRAEEERARLTAILETTTDLVKMSDTRGNVLYLNREFRRLFGLGDRPIENLRIPDLHPGWATRIILDEGIPAAIREGTWRGETAVLARGREVPVSQVILAHRDAAGTCRFLSTIMRDISEHRRLADSLQHAKEAAEKATRAKSEFLANMSHEIRTPMNGILGMTELALGTPLSSKQREYLGLVKSSADSLLEVINDILDFSKIEAGKLDLERDAVRPARRGRQHPAHAGAAGPRQGPGAGLPDRRRRPRGARSATPARLRQVLVNLVGNAIKFTPTGRGRRHDRGGRTGAGDGRSALRRGRHRHRHPRREAAGDLRPLRAGRRLDDAEVRRHGPGADDLRPAGGPDGGPDLGRGQPRRREHLPVHTPGSRWTTTGRATSPCSIRNGCPACAS